MSATTSLTQLKAAYEILYQQVKPTPEIQRPRLSDRINVQLKI